MGGCARFRDELSSFVDETLPARRWDVVAQHLAGCPLCREEAVAIRAVRSALSQSRECAAPADLASRLEAIAGESSTEPLYLGSGGTGLPSRRRRRQQWTVRAVVATLVLTVGVGVTALLLAPAPRELQHAVAETRQQFALQSTAIGVQEAVGAVLLAKDRGASLGTVDAAPASLVPEADPLSISDAAANRLLARAATADVMLSGVQEVLVSVSDERFVRSDVSVNRFAGEGAELVVFDRTGTRFLSSFAPDFAPEETSVPAAWDFATYPVLGVVAGRPAMVLEASVQGRVVGRWWFDVATGVSLRSERFDADGHPTIMAGYRSLRIGQAQRSETAAPVVALDRASTSGTRGWCVGFPVCPYELAGLPLVAHASSNAPGERSMSLVYSDGVQTLSAVWMEGHLADGEPTVAMDAPGLPSVEVWQAGPGMVAIATDGPPRMLEEAKASLPGRSSFERGLWSRLGSGMARLAGLG